MQQRYWEDHRAKVLHVKEENSLCFMCTVITSARAVWLDHVLEYMHSTGPFHTAISDRVYFSN